MGGNGIQAYLLGASGFAPCDSLPVSDRGFRYGMSFFETVAVFGGRAVLAEEHLGLLGAAARAFGPPDGWLDAARALLAEPPFDEGVVRLYVTAGDGGIADAATEPRVLALAESCRIPRSPEPCACACVTFAPQTLLPSVKTGNYWPHLQALARARELGADDALLVAENGRVLSGATSNVFVDLGDGLAVTPPDGAGVRPGAVRGWLLDTGLAAERPLSKDDLHRAAGIFLTNSRVGVRPVTALDGRALPAERCAESAWAAYARQFLGSA